MVEEGFNAYAKRLPPPYQLNLIEIPLLKRTKSTDLKQLIAEEGKVILAKIPSNAFVIALDVQGESFNTEQFAMQLKTCLETGKVIYFLIGGPDGLLPACFEKANLILSLSSLTFLHTLVRIIIAEQCYRAWSLLQNHPYHRS